MIKHVALMKFRSDVPRADLIDRYEREHVPLVRSLLPFFSDYRRNYVADHPMVPRGRGQRDPAQPDFDVATQLWYQDPKQLIALSQALGDPAIEAAILESEARLFDQSTMTILECDEHATPAAYLQPRRAGYSERPSIKLMGLIRKKAGMTREAFIDRYENGHCPLALSVLTKDGMPTFAKYCRTYPVAAPRFAIASEKLSPSAPTIDAITEAWFWTEADFQHFLTQRADPHVAATIADDEAELFDPSSIAIYFVDENL